jgi:hypothetical protein
MDSYLQKLGEEKISDSEWQNIKLFLIEEQPNISLVKLFKSIQCALAKNLISNIDSILYYIQPSIQKQSNLIPGLFPFPLLYPDIVDISRKLDEVSPASSIRFYLFVNNTGLYERSKKAFENYSNRTIENAVKSVKCSTSIMKSIIENIVRVTKYNVVVDLKRIKNYINFYVLYREIYGHIFTFCSEVSDVIHLSEILNCLKLLFISINTYNSCPHLCFNYMAREHEKEKNLLTELMKQEDTNDIYMIVKTLFDGFNLKKQSET